MTPGDLGFRGWVMSELLKQIKLPGKGDINTGLSPCHQSTMLELLGRPRAIVTANCAPVTAPKLKKRMVTCQLGPVTVTGLDVAIESLRKVWARISEADPEVYNAIGTEGMLCCRYVRGSTTMLSNHSWGTAIDLTVAGELCQRGAKTMQAGLLRIYPHFHAEGWYWGAGFPTPDAMHLEMADETLRRLLA